MLNQQCYAGNADFIPLYRLSHFSGNGTKEVNTRGNCQQKVNTEPSNNNNYFQKAYINVSQNIVTVLSFYIMMNILNVLSLTLQFLNSYLNNKVVVVNNVISSILPVFLFFVGFYLIVFRQRFSTKVCLCDFKESYFKIREGWDHSIGKIPEPRKFTREGYGCLETLGTWLNWMIYYEVFISGLHFISVVWNYYNNVFEIKLKKTDDA